MNRIKLIVLDSIASIPRAEYHADSKAAIYERQVRQINDAYPVS